MPKGISISWNPSRTLQKHSRQAKFVEDLKNKLSTRQKLKLKRVAKRLDSKFLLEKAELMRDDMLKILGERKTTRNALLQRNIWASLDAIALHLDYSGFTTVFQEIAPRIFKATRMDDRNIATLEWQLACDYLGGEEELSALGVHSGDVQELFKLAERERSGTCGLPRIARKAFSFKEASAKFCGRPDKILDTVHHSAVFYKVIATIIIIVLDAVLGVLGLLSIIGWWLGVIIFVVSLVIAIVIACLGC